MYFAALNILKEALTTQLLHFFLLRNKQKSLSLFLCVIPPSLIPPFSLQVVTTIKEEKQWYQEHFHRE